MKTEKDIRDFMQGHRMDVPDGDRFMDDIARQIDLLPTPASFEKIDAREQQEKLSAVRDLFLKMKRNNRRNVCIIAMLAVFACSVLAAASYFIYDFFSAATAVPVPLGHGTILGGKFDAIAANMASVLPPASVLLSTCLYFIVALAAIIFIISYGRKAVFRN